MPEDQKYISLQEATKYCPYSQEYLSLLARTGKLKAVKFGRNWVTTKEWIEKYVEKVKNNNQVHQQQEKVVYNAGEDREELSSFTEVPGEEMEIESLPSLLQGSGKADPSPPEIRFREKVRLATLIALLFVLLVSGGVFAIRQDNNEFARWVEKGGFRSVFRETNSYVTAFNQEINQGIVQGWKGVTEIVKATGQAGDFVLEGAAQSLKESFAQVSQDISQFSDDSSQFSQEAISAIGDAAVFGLAGASQLVESSGEILGSISKASQNIGRGLGGQIVSIQHGLGGLAYTAVQVLKETGQGIDQGLEEFGKGMAGIEKGVVEGGKTISEVGSGFGKAFSQGIQKGLKGATEGIKGIGQGLEGMGKGFAKGGMVISQTGSRLTLTVVEGIDKRVEGIVGGAKGVGQGIGQALEGIGQGIGKGIEKGVEGIGAVAQGIGNGVLVISRGVGEGAGGAAQAIIKGGKIISDTSSVFGKVLLQGANKGLEKLGEGVGVIAQGVQNIASGIQNVASELVKIITQPFQRKAVVRVEKEEIQEELEKEIFKLANEIQRLKIEGLPVKEVLREVTQITKIEPIREITREIIRVDESALAEVTTSLTVLGTKISSLENRTSRGLYIPFSSPVPPTSFSVSGNITEGGVFLSSKYISIPGGSVQGDVLYRDDSDWTRLAAGAAGQFLQTQGAGVDPVWAGIAAAGGWTDDGTAVRLTTVGDSVGIGIAAPNAKLEVLATTEQLRLSYDASNRMTFTVGSTGGVTFDAVGAGAGFTFSDNVTIPPASLIFSTANQVTISATNPAVARTYTIPDFGSNDSFVGLAATQTLSNKTFTLPQINDTSADHQYVFGVSELAADRTITLPLLTGNDTFVFAAFAQTLTNKTLTDPTINGTVATTGLTMPAFTGGGTIDMNTNILTNIGNTGTDFVATTGALTLAGVLTANGGITCTDCIALPGETSGNYVASITNGSGIAGGDGGSEGAALTLSLGALTADWNQTGAFDIQLNNASSELKILESVGAAFYGIFDVTDLAADRTYTFPDATGEVTLLGQTIGTGEVESGVTLDTEWDAWAEHPALTSAYILVGNGSNQAAAVAMSGDVAIDNAGATTIQANAVTLATDTTGNYVATIADAGNTTVTVTGSGSENAAVTLDVIDLNCTNCINATEIEDIYVLIAGDTMAGAFTANGVSTFNTDVNFSHGLGENFLITTSSANINMFEIDSSFTTEGSEEHMIRLEVTTGGANSFNDAADSAIDIYFEEPSSDSIDINYKTGLRIFAEGTGTYGANLTNGILMDIEGSGISSITDAINVSDADITNALNIGANAILASGSFTIDLLNASANDTLTITNSNGSYTAALSVEAGITAATLDTGQGANKLYDMNQHVLTSSAVAFDTVDTGFGANELYDMNQHVLTSSAVAFDTVDTGFGANELYDMNQHVLTSSLVTFATLSVLGADGSDDDYIYFDSGTSESLSWSEAWGSFFFTDDIWLSPGGYIGDFATGNSERLCWDGSGGSWITDCTGSPGDYAEYYGTTDVTLEAGDLVAVDPTRPAQEVEKENVRTEITEVDGESVKMEVIDIEKGSKAWVIKTSYPYQQGLIGMVSTQPNEVIGENFEPEENPIPISLNGRVPVKVSTENGPIEIGDPLTSSSIPGVAMKATQSGPIVGKTLESFNGTEGEIKKIIVFVNLSYYIPEEVLIASQSDSQQLEDGSLIQNFVQQVKQTLTSLGFTIENGIAQVTELIAEKITTKTAKIDKLEMVDQSTGEIYCTWIENGEWVKTRGECQQAAFQPIAGQPAASPPSAEISGGEQSPPEEAVPPNDQPPTESSVEQSQTEQPPAEQPPSEQQQEPPPTEQPPAQEPPPIEQPTSEPPPTEELSSEPPPEEQSPVEIP